MMTNPTEVPVVEAVRVASQAMLFPYYLPWPKVSDILWVTPKGAWWGARLNEVASALVVWWN